MSSRPGRAIAREPLSGSETLDPAARAGTHARGSGPTGPEEEVDRAVRHPGPAGCAVAPSQGMARIFVPSGSQMLALPPSIIGGSRTVSLPVATSTTAFRHPTPFVLLEGDARSVGRQDRVVVHHVPGIEAKAARLPGLDVHDEDDLRVHGWDRIAGRPPGTPRQATTAGSAGRTRCPSGHPRDIERLDQGPEARAVEIHQVQPDHRAGRATEDHLVRDAPGRNAGASICSSVSTHAGLGGGSSRVIDPELVRRRDGSVTTASGPAVRCPGPPPRALAEREPGRDGGRPPCHRLAP